MSGSIARQFMNKLRSMSPNALNAVLSSTSKPKVTTAKSASVAKERLQLILAHERGSKALEGVDLNGLQNELLQCLQKYIAVSKDANVNLAVKHQGEFDIFEMQVPVESNYISPRH